MRPLIGRLFFQSMINFFGLNKSLIILFTLLLGGCTIIPDIQLTTPRPTDYLPTSIAMTMAANSQSPQTPTYSETLIFSEPDFPITTLTPETTVEITQQATTQSPNTKKTPTPTPTPTIPEAVIQIVSPGSFSKLISPIKIEAYAQPGANNRINVELIGENGQLIANETRFYNNLTRLWAPVNLELSFKLENAVEFARLQIWTGDQFGRAIAISSVHLLLQSEGINRIYSNTILIDRCIVQSPRANEVASGGILIIEGEFFPYNNQPVLIELIAESGLIVSSKSIQLLPESNNRFSSFKIDIPFNVKNKTPVRLTLSQIDDRIPGKLYVYSQLIIIEP
jgi:hypothetical protein